MVWDDFWGEGEREMLEGSRREAVELGERELLKEAGFGRGD